MSAPDGSPKTIPPRHIVIAGGSGFIASALSTTLRERGDLVTLISRTSGPARRALVDPASRPTGSPDADFGIRLRLSLSRASPASADLVHVTI
jgi:nucleoside-diphosphate-sugar epimerase